MKKVQRLKVNLACNAFWVIVFMLLTFGFRVSHVEAQQLRIGNGIHFVNRATVVVNADSLVIRGTMKNNVDGLIELTGNLKNHGTFTNETGSIITLDGTNPQTIGGSVPTTFNTLNLGNSAGVTLAKDATVNGSLNFQTGILTTGSNLLTIAETGAIVNAAATRYVEGKLANIFSSADTKIFPIGKDGNYRPVTLQFSALTGTSLVTAEQFETGLTGTLPTDVTLTTTNRHWSITQSGGSDMQYFVTLDATGYTPETPVLILKKDGETISAFESTTPNYTNANSLTSFSDFGLGEECVNPTNGGTIEADQVVCMGETPATITNVSYPTGFTGTLGYKWQVSFTGPESGFYDFAGTFTDEYTPEAVTSTCWYKRLARVDCKTNWDGAAGSNVVQITVNPGPVGGTLAGSTSVCYGTNSTLLTLSGYEGDIVRWEYTETDWSTIESVTHTTNTYTAENLETTTHFRVVVKRGDCDTVFSDTATITVYDEFIAGAIHTVGETVCSGGDPVEIGDSIPAAGGDDAIHYQWQKMKYSVKPPVIFENIDGATNASYDPPSGIIESTIFRRTTSDETCNTTPEISFGEWIVMVKEIPTATAGGSEWVCEGNSYTLESGEASASNGEILWTHNGSGALTDETTLTPTYTKGSSPGLTFTDYSQWSAQIAEKGAIITTEDFNTYESMSLFSPASFTTGAYTFIASTNSNLVMTSAYDRELSVYDVDEPLTITFSSSVRVVAGNFYCQDYDAFYTPGDITVDFNGPDAPAPITTSPAGIDNFVGLISSVPITSMVITAAPGTYPTLDNLRLSNSNAAYDKTVTLTMTVSNSPCDPAQDTYTITFDDFTHGAIATTGETIWKGDDAALIGSETDASGGDGAIVYKWQSSITETFDAPVDLETSNSATYDPGTLDVTTWFRRTVKDGTCNTTPETSTGVWKVTVNDPVFEDDMANKSMTWTDALSLAQTSGAETITLLKDYTQTADALIIHDIYFDLNGHTFDGGKANIIAFAKRFGFFNSLTTGTFDNEVQFIAPTSTLALFGNFTPGPLFTTIHSADNGILQVGNGVDVSEFSLTTSNEALFLKVHTFNPRNNATLKMNGGLTTTATIQADDGAVVKLGAGTFTQDFSSTMPTSSTANIQVGDSEAAVVTVTGDFSNYGGTITFFDGSTLNMDLEEMSMNPFTTTIGGSTTATTLVKKGGDFTIGNPSANHGIRLEPYGVLDLSNASNSDDLNVYGNILIFGYDNPNTAKIKFLFTKSGDEIYTNELMTLGGKILTDDPAENQIDVSRQFVFDMNNVTGTLGQTYQIRFATTTGTCSTTGTPVPFNAEGWENFSVSTVPSSETGFFHLILNATYNPCINPTTAGTISSDQEGCDSFDPVEITGTLPTGHNGTIEYKWQKSETSAIADFEDIESSNTQNYNPGTVTTTTWFKRLAIVNCNTDWTDAEESNVVEMTVEQTPVSGTLAKTPNTDHVCEGTDVSAILTAGTGGNGTDKLQFRTKEISWSTWTDYTSGASVTTTTKTEIEIRTWREASFCENSDTTLISWIVEKSPVAGSLVKSPDVDNVCEGTEVSGVLTAGSGGNGTDKLQYRTKTTDWSTWTDYTTGASVTTTSKTNVEIRTWREASYCDNSDTTFVSWMVEPSPISGILAKIPDETNVCEETNVSAALTAGSGGNGSDSLAYRTHNGSIWSSWTNYTTGTDILITGKTQVEIITLRKADYCSDATANTVSWTIEQPPVSGTLAKTPEVAKVCEDSDVSAALTAGSGGNGSDSLVYRTHNGTVWSGWANYTTGTIISTSGKTLVEIQTLRKADYCSTAMANTVSWSVEQTPVSGTLVKTPNTNFICEDENASAILTPGSGGSGNDSLSYRTHNGISWSNWLPYTSGTDISTTGIDTVEIQTLRKTEYCTILSDPNMIPSPISGLPLVIPATTAGLYVNVVTGVVVSGNATAPPGWDFNIWGSSVPIFNSPTGGGCVRGLGNSLYLVDNLAIGTKVDGSDAFGNGEFESYGATSRILNSTENYVGFRFLNENTGQIYYGYMQIGIGASNTDRSLLGVWYSKISNSGIEAGIKNFSNVVRWNVEHKPVNGTLAKTPDFTNVCEGTDVSAALTAGTGGSGNDMLEYRINDGTNWTAWAAYTSGNHISTAGIDSVEIRTVRLAKACYASVVASPVSGLPLAIPANSAGLYVNVVTGAIGYVDATPPAGWDINPYGSSNLTFYSPTGRGFVRGLGNSPTLVDNLAEGTLIDISQYFGTGNIESTGATSRILNSTENFVGFNFLNENTGQTHYGYMQIGIGADNMSRSLLGVWYELNPNTGIEVGAQTIANDNYNTISWIIEEPPVSGVLDKVPNSINVCEGTNVSAALTEGSGGNGTDKLQSRSNDGTIWSSWTDYTTATNILTTDKTTIEIRTWREATQCNNSDTTYVSWTVEQTPVVGTLSKTPDHSTVCIGTNIAATLTGGTGGNGNNKMQSRTNNGTNWSSWADYTSATTISSSDKTGIEIRTWREASYCNNSDTTLVSWSVEQTPVTGTLTKTPDLIDICEGEFVSATLNAGSGGNGTDSLSYRTHNGTTWSNWTIYASGSQISTTGKTQVEIQTIRKADYCNDDDAFVVNWIVDLTSPSATVINSTVLLDQEGVYTLLVSDVLSDYNDNVTPENEISIEMDPSSFTCAHLDDVVQVTVTLTDNCGNETIVYSDITVLQGNTLLSPWENDNTHVSANGTATYASCDDDGTFRLTSTGQSTTTSDVYHYVYQELCGNGTIIARLDEVENGGWAGVMMRETNDAGSRTLLFKTRLYNSNVIIGYRAIPNKSITNINQVIQMIRWMKIQRNGNTFQVFTSFNGTSWTRRYSTSIAMNSCINAGIFTESIKSNRISIARFDHVELADYLKKGDVVIIHDSGVIPEEPIDIVVYPNPAKDVVNITLTGFETLSGLNVTLLTTDGKKVKPINLTGFQTQLDVQDLQPGVYILRFENTENVIIKRVVIQ